MEVEGHGDGLDSKTLKTPPTSVTQCASMRKLSDAVIFDAIKNGGGGVGLSDEMPAWGKGISDDDIRGVVAFIRMFCAKE